MAFSAQQFCVLFESICSADVIATAGIGSTESSCETGYAAVAASAQQCRTQHLCNANVSTAMEKPHCYHAQGWGSATMMAGSPCQ